MYNLLISAGAAIAVFLIVSFTAGLEYWWAGLLAALLVFLGSFLLISRIITKKLEAIMEPAMKDIQAQRFEIGRASCRERV